MNFLPTAVFSVCVAVRVAKSRVVSIQQALVTLLVQLVTTELSCKLTMLTFKEQCEIDLRGVGTAAGEFVRMSSPPQ